MLPYEQCKKRIKKKAWSKFAKQDLKENVSVSKMLIIIKKVDIDQQSTNFTVEQWSYFASQK